MQKGIKVMSFIFFVIEKLTLYVLKFIVEVLELMKILRKLCL